MELAVSLLRSARATQPAANRAIQGWGGDQMIPKTGHAFIQTMVKHQNLRGRFVIDGLGNEPRAPLTPSTHYYQKAMFSVCACLWIFRVCVCVMHVSS